MPTFSYTARDTTGSPVSGSLVAVNPEEVSRLLRAEGKYPTSIQAVEDAKSHAAVGGRGVKISRADVIQFSNQLSIMVETGVTLSEALHCIATQAEKPNVKKLVSDVEQIVEAGGDLSGALARHPRSFPQLYVALIKASEKSGMLSKLLARATAYLRDEQETLRRVKGALIYPAIMFTFAMGTTIFLLTFVLPKFTAIYASKGAALPVPTKILMNLSNFLIDHWMLLGICIITVAGGLYAFAQTITGRRIMHFIQLNVPLFGAIFRKLYLARGLRMVGTMAGAGISLVECVATAGELSANTYFRDLWSDVSQKIQAGRQLCEPMFESRLVPRSIAQMLHSGEKSGKLAFVMEQVSAFAEAELKEKIVEMTRYIEPAMIVVMGIIIGGVALALLLPIFTISRVVAH